jgi:hypothetical protein
MRKNAFVEAGGFDETLRYAEDTDLWRRLSWRNEMHQMDETLVRIRRGDHQAMADKHERIRNLFELKVLLKTWIDTPEPHRQGLPGMNYIIPRLTAVIVPAWVCRFLHALTPRTRWIQFRRWLRPRTRINQLCGYQIFESGSGA